MAELQIRTFADGSPGGYRDMDIQAGWNNRQILRQRTDRVIYARLRNGDEGSGFFKDPAGLAYHYLNTVSPFRFERTGSITYDKVSTSTGEREEVVVSGLPGMVDRWKRHKGKLVFGSEAEAVWFDSRGIEDYSQANLDAVWLEIEARTPLLKADHLVPIHTPPSLKKYLFLRTSDFSDSRMVLIAESDPKINATTVLAATSRRIFTIAEGSLTNDDEHRGQDIEIEKLVGGERFGSFVSDYDSATRTIVIRDTPPFVIATGDLVRVEHNIPNGRRKHFIDYANDLGYTARQVSDLRDRSITVPPDRSAERNETTLIKTR